MSEREPHSAKAQHEANAGTIEQAADERAPDIEKLNIAFVGAVAGVAQAMDRLKSSMNDIGTCLHERDFRKASALGYRGVASDFVFLQRALADLDRVENDKDALIQDIAARTTGVFEDVAPFIERRIAALQKKS